MNIRFASFLVFFFGGGKKYQLTCDMEIIRKLIMKRNGSIECSLVVGILLDLSDNVSTFANGKHVGILVVCFHS